MCGVFRKHWQPAPSQAVCEVGEAKTEKKKEKTKPLTTSTPKKKQVIKQGRIFSSRYANDILSRRIIHHDFELVELLREELDFALMLLEFLL
jgi:hypothetical protein